MTGSGATGSGATGSGATGSGATEAGATEAGATEAGATEAGTTGSGTTAAGEQGNSASTRQPPPTSGAAWMSPPHSRTRSRRPVSPAPPPTEPRRAARCAGGPLTTSIVTPESRTCTSTASPAPRRVPERIRPRFLQAAIDDPRKGAAGRAVDDLRITGEPQSRAHTGRPGVGDERADLANDVRTGRAVATAVTVGRQGADQLADLETSPRRCRRDVVQRLRRRPGITGRELSGSSLQDHDAHRMAHGVVQVARDAQPLDADRLLGKAPLLVPQLAVHLGHLRLDSQVRGDGQSAQPGPHRKEDQRRVEFVLADLPEKEQDDHSRAPASKVGSGPKPVTEQEDNQRHSLVGVAEGATAGFRERYRENGRGGQQAASSGCRWDSGRQAHRRRMQAQTVPPISEKASLRRKNTRMARAIAAPAASAATSTRSRTVRLGGPLDRRTRDRPR